MMGRAAQTEDVDVDVSVYATRGQAVTLEQYVRREVWTDRKWNSMTVEYRQWLARQAQRHVWQVS